jgi:large conductance mechanosensitive channel
MKKIFDEFKAFINKGSVMDLAVGMIIGSAFTAIVTSLVKNILTPLINWIPGTGEAGALQTVLREAVVDANGNVVTDALILDWGQVISAIVTFFITAVVLFFIVKAFNRLKATGVKVKEDADRAIKKVTDKLENKSEEVPTEKTNSAETNPTETQSEKTDTEKSNTEEAEKTPASAEPPETAEELLKRIIVLLEKK